LQVYSDHILMFVHCSRYLHLELIICMWGLQNGILSLTIMKHSHALSALSSARTSPEGNYLSKLASLFALVCNLFWYCSPAVLTRTDRLLPCHCTFTSAATGDVYSQHIQGPEMWRLVISVVDVRSMLCVSQSLWYPEPIVGKQLRVYQHRTYSSESSFPLQKLATPDPRACD
jgi:hypothetical protein